MLPEERAAGVADTFRSTASRGGRLPSSWDFGSVDVDPVDPVDPVDNWVGEALR